MTLWRKNGGEPTSLPEKDYDDDNNLYSDLANNPEGLAACGWEEADDPPEHDSNTQYVYWDNGDWAIGELPEPEISTAKTQYVNIINDRRDSLIDSGFMFDGNMYQSRPSDRENISGMAIFAQMAIAQGAALGNYRWADPANDFVWITASNDLVMMDAYDVIGLFTAGVTFKKTLTFYARELKDQILAAEDHDELEAIDIFNDWPA